MPADKSFWSQVRGYPLIVFLTCLLGWSLTSMDQSLFGYAVPGIQEEFGASYSDVGWILSISFVFAAFTSAIIGTLTDRYGRRTLFLFCLAFSALLVGLHAFVVGLMSLTILRMFAFGLSNGLAPITNSFVAETAPARYRGMMVAFIQCGYPIGWFVASLFVVPLIAVFGWRYIFVPALLVIPIAFLLIRYLPESKRFTEAKAKREAESQAGQGAPKEPFFQRIKELFAPDLRKRSIMIFIAFFCFGGAYAGTAFFFPAYFNEFRGYSVETATKIVGMSYGVGILGYIGVAFVGEFVLTRRNTVALWAILGSLATLGLMWLPETEFQDMLWFGIMAAFFYGNAAALSMFMVEVFPTRVRATAAGLVGSFALNLGHATFPIFVAYGIETIGWQWSFTLAVVPFMLTAAAAILTLDNVKSGLDLEEIAQ
ncbi:MAG: MFS transporter [Rhodospirillaceae bacterium]|jgi:MFS family permease|nr:MFS transporter [Rhodospirillaceae bacterium]MBT5241315.1 MFS transporter [Rhodospirillaceae bacterium]MBT5565050.1 MFS transporter [Rhodospirillaceae bacterium]